MRFLILVSSTLALIVALVLVLILARIPLAELVATRAMESAGLEHAALKIRQFDASHLVITGAEFIREDASGATRVELRDMRVDYRIAQLADGELKRISIERLVLHHVNTNAAAAPAEPLDQAELLRLLNTDWRALVPIDTFTINRIELAGSGFGPFDHTALRLQMYKTAGDVETRLEHLGAQADNRSLIATLAADTLEVDLGITDMPDKPALHATAKTAASGIDIHWRLLPTALKAWLEPFANIADIGSGAAVNGALNIDLTTAGRISAKMDTDTKNYHIAGYKLLRPALRIYLQTDIKLPGRRIDIMPGSYVRVAGIDSDTISIGKALLNLHAVIVNPDDQWSIEGVATSSRLPVSYTDYAFVLKDIQNHVHVDADGVSLNTTISPENLPGKFVFGVSHSMASASGKASLTMPQPIDLDGEESHLAQLLATWPFPFDLASGTLQLTGNATWSGGALHKLHAGVRFADIGGHYKELLFSGLNFRQELDVLPAYSSPRAGELSIEHIDAGVAINNVSARINVGSSDYGALPKLFVDGLSGHLFDGNFSGDPFAYDLNAPANAITIHAHGIDLAEVVATQQFGDIEVSGRIDGDLPVELNPYGVFINNGSLHNSTPEGVIRYRPAAGAGGLDQNPLTGIALKALSDFHYDTLKARANFVPDGTLTLNFELNGTSPPLQTTRPVHLNINTEQNLLSLLKSIRYVDGLNQGLDKSVRELYQRRNGN
jgi:hypothetical protein